MHNLLTSLLITGTFIFLSAPRLLRWLAIVQQKEYRFDRIWIFLKTDEGIKELLKFFPRPQDLTRVGLKRPARTARLYIVLVIIFFLVYATTLVMATTESIIVTVVGLVFLYAIWPAIVFFALVPTAIFSNAVTAVFLHLAQVKMSRSKPIVIGITGSYGKSTTKYLIKEILSKLQPVFSTPLSYNTRFSIARSILKNYHGEKIAILEFGAYKIGEIKTLCHYFPPTMAVITGFSPQHLGLFGSEENIIKAKSELVAALPTNAPVFYNDGDTGAVTIANTRSDTTLLGIKNIDFSNVDLANLGSLSFYWNNQNIVTKIIGRHYETNLKLAVAIGEYFQVPTKDIAAALTEFVPNSIVIKVKQNTKGTLIIDDGKTSNPKGFEAALGLAAELKSKNSIKHATLVTAGIVDLGEKSAQVHKDIAQRSHQSFDQVYYLGLNGSEEFKTEYKENFMEDATAICKYLTEKITGDLVLVEGRVPKWIYETLNF